MRMNVLSYVIKDESTQGKILLREVVLHHRGAERLPAHVQIELALDDRNGGLRATIDRRDTFRKTSTELNTGISSAR
jgi:hypothetical protein